MGESEESAGINLGKVGVGAREGMEYIVLGRGNNMCKKRELGLLRELKVVLCMTGNHIAKPGEGGGKRAPRDKGVVTGKVSFIPIKECALYLEGNRKPLKACMQRTDLSRLAF